MTKEDERILKIILTIFNVAEANIDTPLNAINILLQNEEYFDRSMKLTEEIFNSHMSKYITIKDKEKNDERK